MGCIIYAGKGMWSYVYWLLISISCYMTKYIIIPSWMVWLVSSGPIHHWFVTMNTSESILIPAIRRDSRLVVAKVPPSHLQYHNSFGRNAQGAVEKSQAGDQSLRLLPVFSRRSSCSPIPPPKWANPELIYFQARMAVFRLWTGNNGLVISSGLHASLDRRQM